MAFFLKIKKKNGIWEKEKVEKSAPLQNCRKKKVRSKKNIPTSEFFEKN